MPRTPDECASAFCPPSEVLNIGTAVPPCVPFLLRSVVCLLLLLIFHQTFVTHASAQSTTATLSGTVVDEAGAVVPAVNIVVIRIVNGFERSTRTGGDGTFVV